MPQRDNFIKAVEAALYENPKDWKPSKKVPATGPILVKNMEPRLDDAMTNLERFVGKGRIIAGGSFRQDFPDQAENGCGRYVIFKDRESAVEFIEAIPDYIESELRVYLKVLKGSVVDKNLIKKKIEKERSVLGLRMDRIKDYIEREIWTYE